MILARRSWPSEFLRADHVPSSVSSGVLDSDSAAVAFGVAAAGADIRNSRKLGNWLKNALSILVGWAAMTAIPCCVIRMWPRLGLSSKPAFFR